MAEDNTYSLDFVDTLSFNLIHQALRQDRQIMWYNLRDTFATHQIFSDWLHQVKHFDEDDILKNLKVILNNYSTNPPIVGYSANQLSIWQFTPSIDKKEFTETSFRESAKKLGFDTNTIDKLDQECADIVQKYFAKVQRPIINATEILQQAAQVLDEAIVNWTVSIDDSIKIGLIYDAIGGLLFESTIPSTHSIATPEVLYKKLKALFPTNIPRTYTYPKISGTGSELAKIAKLRQAVNY